jgi:hypothetical protein
MNITLFELLLNNINNQIQVFDEISKINVRFRESVLNKEWRDINESIGDLTERSVKISNLESDRVDILIDIAKELKSSKTEDFFSLLSKAPIDLKNKILDSYYLLRSKVITTRGVYKGLNEYIEHKRELSREVINVLVNDARGNTYSKPGRKDLGSNNFIVDRQL